VGHPLRKDYQEAGGYHGIGNARPDPLVQLVEGDGREAQGDLWRRRPRRRLLQRLAAVSTTATATPPRPRPRRPRPRLRPRRPGHSNSRALCPPSSRKGRASHGHRHGARPAHSSPHRRSDEEIVVNFGPQHPSTHGVINFVTQTNGEVIRRSVPDIGYLHRGLEKIGELVPYPGYMPFTDRIDYLAAMFANEGYAVAIERLLGVEAPPRAKYIRAIAGELCRISNHFISIGTMAQDIGAATPLTHALRERESINDLLEELCGARLTFNFHRIGGVAFDLPAGWGDKVLRFLDHLDSYIQEWDRLITFNKIFVKRLANVGVITREKAIDYGLAGPNLRGSGVNWDIRRDMPYGAYPDFEFNIPVGTGRSAPSATAGIASSCACRRSSSRRRSSARPWPSCPRATFRPRWRAS
jgi:hypothetical protein